MLVLLPPASRCCWIPAKVMLLEGEIEEKCELVFVYGNENGAETLLDGRGEFIRMFYRVTESKTFKSTVKLLCQMMSHQK